jgi:hypothetical protein
MNMNFNRLQPTLTSHTFTNASFSRCEPCVLQEIPKNLPRYPRDSNVNSGPWMRGDLVCFFVLLLPTPLLLFGVGCHNHRCCTVHQGVPQGLIVYQYTNYNSPGSPHLAAL